MSKNYLIYDNKSKYACGIAITAAIIFLLIPLISEDTDNFITSNTVPAAAVFLLCGGFGLGFLFTVLSNWLFPKEKRFSLRAQLYDRANLHRKESYIVLAIIFIISIGAAVVFYKASSFARDDLTSLYIPKQDKLNQIRIFVGNDEFKQIMKDVLKSASSGPVAWVPFALMTALRIGDIAVASFLTVILTKLYRYNLRLSAFYYSRADAMVLCKDKYFSQVNRERLPHLMDANLEFGTELTTVAQSVAQLVDSFRSRRQSPHA